MGIFDQLGGILGTNNQFQASPYQVNQGAFQDPSAAANRSQIQGALQNYGQQLGQTQGNQSQLIGALQSQMAGQGPSVAQNQLRMAQDQNAQQSMALAASGGGNPALALRQAQIGQAQAGQQAAGQGAMLRAQEQLSAQQQLGGILGQQMGTYAGAQLSGMGLSQQQSQQQVANAMALQGLQSQNYNPAHGINAGIAGQNAQAAQGLAGGVLGGLAGGWAGALGGSGGLGSLLGGSGSSGGILAGGGQAQGVNYGNLSGLYRGPAYADGGMVDAQDGYGMTAPTNQYKKGGNVRGPGGPKDDLVMARLSDGEFVVNAAATNKYRPLLEAINAEGKKMPTEKSGGQKIDPSMIKALTALHGELSRGQ